MTTITVELPEQIVQELGSLVDDGWFEDETEIVRMALLTFVRQNRLSLMERFQREDIAWALQTYRDQKTSETAAS